MDKLTPTLTEVQIKQNIDALKSGGMSNAKIQEYVNNYTRDPGGNFVLKNQALSNAPSNSVTETPPVEKSPSIVDAQHPIQQAGIGAAKGVINTVFGAAKLGQKLANPIERALGLKETNIGELPQSLKPEGTAQKVGSTIEQIAELAVPFSAASKVAKGAKLGVKALAEGTAGGVATAIQEQDQRKAIDAALLSASFPVLGAAFRKAGSIAGNEMKKAAPRVINSLIKPLSKDFSYGKNPGRAVSEEGIIAKDFDELVQKIGERKNAIGEQIKSAISRVNKPLDLLDALKPIDDAMSKAKFAPRTNAGLISRLENAKKDILGEVVDDAGNIANTRKLTGVSPLEAFNLKQSISEITKFTGNASDDGVVNKALKQSYGTLKEKINKVVPEITKLNEKYADLSAAKIAAEYRDKIVERQNLVSLTPKNIIAGGGIASLFTANPAPAVIALGIAGLERSLSTPQAKTQMAAWLAKTSPEIKREVFNANPYLKAAVIKVLNID